MSDERPTAILGLGQVEVHRAGCSCIWIDTVGVVHMQWMDPACPAHNYYVMTDEHGRRVRVFKRGPGFVFSP